MQLNGIIMETLGDTVETFGKWIAVLGSCSFGVSIVFDYGFYSALGMSFSDVPTQIADHVRSALIWLPILFFCVVGIAVLDVIQKAFFSSTFTDKKTGKRNSLAEFLFLVFLLFCQVMVFLFGDEFAGLSLAYTIYFFVSFSEILLAKPSLEKYNTTIVKFIYVTCPIIVIGFYSWGKTEAINHFHDQHRYSVIHSSDNTKEKLIIIRELERGILVSDESRKITFLQWSEIKRIETIGRYFESIGMMCQLFGKNCKPTKSVEP